MTARRVDHLIRECDRLRVCMTALAGLFVGLLAGLLLVACSGCSATTSTHGVPNLVQVRADVWRSGQPTTLEQWQYLYGLGIRHSIKLDFDDEGTDDDARLASIEVRTLGIEPRVDPNGLGLSLSSADGYVYECGDAAVEFTIQSILKQEPYKQL